MTDPATEWLAIGRISKPHGVHGELVVEVLTDFPQRLQPGIEVGVGTSGPASLRQVHSVRWHKGGWLVALTGVFRREQADELRGCFVFLPAQPREALPASYYYEHDLVGAVCQDGSGTELGVVDSLVFGGAQTLLAVRSGAGSEVLVPFISPIVVRVDPAARRIILDPPRGLFDGDAL